MKSLNEIKNALATANKEMFTNYEVAELVGMSKCHLSTLINSALSSYAPRRTASGYEWSKSDIIAISEELLRRRGIIESNMLTTHDAAKYLGIPYSTMSYYIKKKLLIPDIVSARNLPNRYSKATLDKFKEYLDSKSAKSESETPAPIAPITAVPEPVPAEYVSPIDVLLQINKTMTEDPNVRAYYDMKNRFEQMNESALQKLFAPLLERFKFSYICKCIPEIQSQMLTCINKGKLRGMEKYGMDFNAFLKLIKFAHDNYVPLDSVDEQKN